MNAVVSTTSNELFNCGKSVDGYNMNKVFLQYGIETGIDKAWEQIIKLDSANAKKSVDSLLQKISMNSKENGFFDANQPVYIGYSGFGFKLNDYNLYYMFFNNLKGMSESAEGKQNKGSIVFNSIKQTINDYFGGVVKNSRAERMSLTAIDNNFEFPSICNQRGTGTAFVTEMAAAAHNLWLLAGKESFYVSSQDCKLENANVKQKNLESDMYAFNVVNTGNGYCLCDFASARYEALEAIPLELIKAGKPIVFGSDVYYGKNLQQERTM